MSGMLKQIQTQLMSKFEAARTASGDYPAELEYYGGQLRDPDRVENLPALYIDMPDQFSVTSDDVMFEQLDMEGNPQLIMFAENQASVEDNRQEIRKLIDWAIDNVLHGLSITVNDTINPLQGIDGRVLSEYGKHGRLAAAVLDLDFTSHQG